MMKIGQFQIGEFARPYIIAEIGVNHGGDKELAKALISQAASAGANAAKFQTYKAEMLACRDSPAYWDTTKEPTTSQFELFKKYDAFNAADYADLAFHCESVGIDFMSTPFDLPSVAMLKDLVICFKLASADITNIPLLREVGGTKKLVIMSTGAATLSEVQRAVEILRDSGAKDIMLLHCVLNYPTCPSAAQLGAIHTLKNKFPECYIGYSDHVPPGDAMDSLRIATLMGACVIEKHFTHDKTLPGNDHYHAMDVADLMKFNKYLDLVRTMYGRDFHAPDFTEKSTEGEIAARRHARRSIVSARDIKAGEKLDNFNLISKRPGTGISAAQWDDIIGCTAASNIAADSMIKWQDLIESYGHTYGHIDESTRP